MAQVKVFRGSWHVLVMCVRGICIYIFMYANFFCIGVVIMLFALLQNLLRREPLKLVDGGQSQRTFVFIKDAIEAVLLMIVSGIVLLLTYNLHMEVASKQCDIILRKIQPEPMVRFSMSETLTMKLQLGSLVK